MRKFKIILLTATILLLLVGFFKYTNLKTSHDTLSRNIYYDFRGNLYSLLDNSNLTPDSRHILQSNLADSFSNLLSTFNIDEKAKNLSALITNLQNINIESLNKSDVNNFLVAHYTKDDSGNIIGHVLDKNYDYFYDLQKLLSKGSFLK